LKKFLIITGGSSGIGFAAAKLFQDNGFNIINLSRSKINLDDAVHIEVDLSRSNWQESLESIFKETL
jgi:short-subunit dehydrogenase